jgi:hypothetical protein
MIQNLVCLDFFKDVEQYVTESKFESKSDEMQMHLIQVEDLL